MYKHQQLKSLNKIAYLRPIEVTGRTKVRVKKTPFFKAGREYEIVCKVVLQYTNGRTVPKPFKLKLNEDVRASELRNLLNFLVSKDRVKLKDEPFRINWICGEIIQQSMCGNLTSHQKNIEDFCEETESEVL